MCNYIQQRLMRHPECVGEIIRVEQQHENIHEQPKNSAILRYFRLKNTMYGRLSEKVEKQIILKKVIKNKTNKQEKGEKKTFKQYDNLRRVKRDDHPILGILYTFVLAVQPIACVTYSCIRRSELENFHPQNWVVLP